MCEPKQPCIELSEEEFSKLEAIAEAESTWDVLRAADLPLRDVVKIPLIMAHMLGRSWWRRRFPRQSALMSSYLYRLEMRWKDRLERIKGAR
jgi:hypothetical protein